MTQATPKLNVQYDYITLKLPAGNFTYKRYGSKTTGQLAHMKALAVLENYVLKSDKSVGEAMQELTNPELLNKLIPGWDTVVKAELYIAGDKVVFVNDAYKKRYSGIYEVHSVKGKYTYVRIFNTKLNKEEIIGFYTTELARA